MKVVKEKYIERRGHERAKECGVLHLKFVSPGRNAVPDRLVLGYVPEWLRESLASCIRFVEYKRPGEKPTPAQEREHARLRAMGFVVDVIDNPATAEQIMEAMCSNKDLMSLAEAAAASRPS